MSSTKKKKEEIETGDENKVQTPHGRSRKETTDLQSGEDQEGQDPSTMGIKKILHLRRKGGPKKKESLT